MGEPTLRCSFCLKSQDVVAKLVCSPREPRTYICDECITVCAWILEDEHGPSLDATPPEELNHLLYHPLVSQFLDAVERWIGQESLGMDAAEEFAEMRRKATRMIASSK
jgi:ATP-dependent Clp protease ATP-binding subunit ClpX